MGSQRTHSARRAALAALPLILGCAQIAGTDDYAVGVDAKAMPFLTGSGACDACAAKNCGTQFMYCEQDAVCSSWLKDIRERPDPISAHERSQIENELRWSAVHDGASYNDNIEGLRSCAQFCLNECAIGQDFSCVGNFDWDLPHLEKLRTRVALRRNVVGPSEPLEAHVRACLSADQCESPLDSQTTDEAGFAELKLQVEADEPGGVSVHVVTEVTRPWQWAQTRPLADNDYLQLDLPTDESVDGWRADFARNAGGEHAMLVVVPVDCAGVHAKQVTLEAWYYPPDDRLTFCEDCFYAYGDGILETPSAQLPGFVTMGRAGYIIKPTPGMVYVAARRMAEPRDVLSVARFEVQGGDAAVVRLYPASKAELASFGDLRN